MVTLRKGHHGSDRNAVLIAWLNWPFVLAFAGFVAYTIADTVNEARATASVSFARTVGDTCGRAVLVAVLCVVVTARVIGTREGVVRVFNVFFETDVPVDQILRIDTRDGFEILGGDGQRIPVSVLGQSLMGAVLGYRRSRRAAERYDKWHRSLRVSDGGVPPSSGRVRRVRHAWYLAPAWLAPYLLLAISVRMSG